MSVTKAYEEVIEFIAAGPSSERVAEYRASENARARTAELISLEKREGLTPEQEPELHTYLQLEHIMRLAKASARRKIETP